VSDQLERCVTCNDPFVLHRDGTIRCWGCEAVAPVKRRPVAGWRYLQRKGETRGQLVRD
jgi:hypothetical protein